MGVRVGVAGHDLVKMTNRIKSRPVTETHQYELTYYHAFVSRWRCRTSLTTLTILQFRLQYGRSVVESHQNILN
jgi:hypothetical protein